MENFEKQCCKRTRPFPFYDVNKISDPPPPPGVLPRPHGLLNQSPLFGSLRTADAFPVVASLPPKNSNRPRNASAVRRLAIRARGLNNCFSRIQLVGQKYRDETTLAS